MNADHQDLASGGETPIVQRLHPRHVQDAKALIRAVWQEHFGSHREPFVRDFLLLPNALDDIDAAAMATDADRLFLVQEVRNRVVATGAIHGVSDEVCEMSRMFVAGAWRKRGLATTLAHRLLDFARTRNFGMVRLASNKQLTSSHRLYHSLGFRPCPSWEAEDDGHSVSMQLSL